MSDDRTMRSAAAAMRYERNRAETRAAMQEYEAASARLKLAQIRERLSELEAQYEPLHSILIDGALDDREKALEAAFYVVVGRRRKE